MPSTILGTGLSGLVGSRVTFLLSPQYAFENLSLETGVDITNKETVFSFIKKTTATWVFHFAAVTDVDACEKEKNLGEKSTSWKVNVLATEAIAQACATFNKKLLYISTDFVFPGGNTVFTEEDLPDPIGWYAVTKYEGEKRVQELKENALIVRISFPYGSVNKKVKPDFVSKLIQRFENQEPVVSPHDQIFCPTYIDDIALGIRFLIEKNASGVFHLVGSNWVSGFEAACAIADEFGFDKTRIKTTSAKEFYAGRAPRAFQLMLSNAKIAQSGFFPVDFQTGLKLLHTQ